MMLRAGCLAFSGVDSQVHEAGFSVQDGPVGRQTCCGHKRGRNGLAF
jgi:hypothetical protein